MTATILQFPARWPADCGATANLLALAERELPLLRIAGDILNQPELVLAGRVRRMVAIGESETLRETEWELTIGAEAYRLIAEAVSTARDRLRDALAECTGPPQPAA